MDASLDTMRRMRPKGRRRAARTTPKERLIGLEGFSPLEQRLIATVREILPGPAQTIFDGQIATIKRIERHPKEIRFYNWKRGKKPSGCPAKFPLKDDFSLAEVCFSVAGRNYKATLNCVGGRFSYLVIRPSPARIAFSDWDSAPCARLLSDPLETPGPQPIPDVWREFLAGRPRPPRGWTFYNAESAYRLPLDQGEFLVLAQRLGDAFLLHRIDPPTDELFYLPWGEDGEPEPLEGDFLDIFREDLMNPLV